MCDEFDVDQELKLKPTERSFPDFTVYLLKWLFHIDISMDATYSHLDYEYRKFMASKARKLAPTIVTESMIQDLPIGTVLSTLNISDLTYMTPIQVSDKFKTRHQRLIATTYSRLSRNAKRKLEITPEPVKTKSKNNEMS